MNAARDDALSWAGDDDPTLDAGDAPEDSDELPAGWTVVGEPGRVDGPEGEGPSDGTPAAEQAPQQTGSVMLVTLGVLGGIYLLYMIGYAVVATRVSAGSADPVAQLMFAVGTGLAIAAPALWFGVSLWLTRGRPRARLLWLIGGVILLVPLPFLLGTGVTS